MERCVAHASPDVCVSWSRVCSLHPIGPGCATRGRGRLRHPTRSRRTRSTTKDGCGDASCQVFPAPAFTPGWGGRNARHAIVPFTRLLAATASARTLWRKRLSARSPVERGSALAGAGPQPGVNAGPTTYGFCQESWPHLQDTGSRPPVRARLQCGARTGFLRSGRPAATVAVRLLIRHAATWSVETSRSRAARRTLKRGLQHC